MIHRRILITLMALTFTLLVSTLIIVLKLSGDAQDVNHVSAQMTTIPSQHTNTAPTEPQESRQTQIAATSVNVQESALDRIKRLIAPVPDAPPNSRFQIRVFLDRQIVAVYPMDSDPRQAIPTQAFICSSAAKGYTTPLGPSQIGNKYPEGYMIDGSWGMFCSQLNGGVLFHAMPSYGGTPNKGIRWNEYNLLGSIASHGCVRLTCRDAIWIYRNCPTGTPLEVLASSEGYNNLPTTIDTLKMKADGPPWDPTNPDPKNPYQQNPALLLP